MSEPPILTQVNCEICDKLCDPSEMDRHIANDHGGDENCNPNFKVLLFDISRQYSKKHSCSAQLCSTVVLNGCAQRQYSKKHSCAVLNCAQRLCSTVVLN